VLDRAVLVDDLVEAHAEPLVDPMISWLGLCGRRHRPGKGFTIGGSWDGKHHPHDALELDGDQFGEDADRWTI
jgi:hypothetical protein